MAGPRDVRDALEKSQQECLRLRARVDEFTAEVELLKAQLRRSHGEQERLARLVLQELNPAKQTSAFSVDDVAALVAFLKKP